MCTTCLICVVIVAAVECESELVSSALRRLRGLVANYASSLAAARRSHTGGVVGGGSDSPALRHNSVAGCWGVGGWAGRGSDQCYSSALRSLHHVRAFIGRCSYLRPHASRHFVHRRQLD